MNCRYLTFEDRKKIETLYAAGADPYKIAVKLGVHLATVYRELKRGGTGKIDENGRIGYKAGLAQKAFQESIKRRGNRSLIIRKK